MIVYVDLFDRLREKGWTIRRLVRERKLGNGTISRLRNGESVSTDTIDTICELLQCQPGDILRYEEEE